MSILSFYCPLGSLRHCSCLEKECQCFYHRSGLNGGLYQSQQIALIWYRGTHRLVWTYRRAVWGILLSGERNNDI